MVASWSAGAAALFLATGSTQALAADCPGLEATLKGATACGGDSFKVRAVAAVALGAKKTEDGTRALMAALESDPHYAVRAAAASGLGRAQDPQAVGALLRALSDDTVLVREQAERALTRLHRPEALLAFRDALGSRQLEKRRAAVAAYATVFKNGHEQASVAVVNALGDSDDGIRQMAKSAIEDVPLVKALTSLLDALENGEEDVRAASARALARRPDPMAVDGLIDARQRLGEGAKVRQALRTALVAHQEWLDTQTLRTKAVDESDEETRLRALDLLTAVGDAQALPLLKKALASSSGRTRATAGRLLQEMGGDAAKAALDAAVKKEKDPRTKRQLELSARRLR